MNMLIRPIERKEIMLLSDFLYEAIFQRDTENPLPRTVIQVPSLWAYIDSFGSKEDDHCLVAEIEGYIVGAVWVRCIHSYGHIDDEVPEFAISVYPQYRGKGVGTALMKKMLKILKADGYLQASLAVQKDNYAVKMYEKVGFEIIVEKEQEYIMVCNLSDITIS